MMGVDRSSPAGLFSALLSESAQTRVGGGDDRVALLGLEELARDVAEEEEEAVAVSAGLPLVGRNEVTHGDRMRSRPGPQQAAADLEAIPGVLRPQ